jgi:hypothetical protein
MSQFKPSILHGFQSLSLSLEKVAALQFFRHPPVRSVNPGIFSQLPTLGDCVVIMMEGRFRRDRQSGSSALECGHLKLWVIGLLRNGILFMGLEP